MTHLAEQLSALVDGELPGADLDRVNAHLAGCAECRAEAAALRQLKRALRALGEVTTDDDGDEALTERLLVLAGPGGPVPSRKRRRAQYRATRQLAGPRRAVRHPRGRVRGRYVAAWSVVSLMLVGLGTAAFSMGGSTAGQALDMQLSPPLTSAQNEGQTADGPSARDKASRATTRRQAMALRLLSKAASAGQATSYQGVELLSGTGVSGDVTTVAQVQHPAAGPPNAVFGLSTALVSLLGKHYVALLKGNSAAAGRAALLVELHRFDGSLAARFWLDRATMLPLRREVFDAATNLISEDAFLQVNFGGQTRVKPGGRAQAEQAFAEAGTAPAGPVWEQAASPTAFLTMLQRAGWRLPSALPGGLSLYTAATYNTGGGEEIDLGYSDGLFVISLLAQHGTLAKRPAGSHTVALDGRTVYVSGHSVTWAAPGLVYTVTADAPPQTVVAMVAALPPSGPAGFFGRLGQGFDRLASLINPLG